MPHPVLDFGEGLFNRVEIRRVGRQEPEPYSGGLDDLSHLSGFVAAKIVYDEDVAWSENGRELLLDIGAEALAVDGPVENARCCEVIGAQGTQKGQRQWSCGAKLRGRLPVARQPWSGVIVSRETVRLWINRFGRHLPTVFAGTDSS